MKTERLTSQKQLIYDYLRSSKDHPSVDEVYQNVKKKLPRISLATVYRIVNDYKRKGKIKEIPGNHKRLEGDLQEHGHFICQDCQAIVDFDLDLSENLKKQKSLKNFKINNFEIYCFGKCKKCKQITALSGKGVK